MYVVTRYRDAGQNPRTQAERIIRRAGIDVWPKEFQNLRSSRETELAETFPIHVVVKWIGNSEAVARKHYLQVTDEHFAKAIGTVTASPETVVSVATGTTTTAGIATPDGTTEKAKQKAKQYGANLKELDGTTPIGCAPLSPLNPDDSSQVLYSPILIVPLRGFEPRLSD